MQKVKTFWLVVSLGFMLGGFAGETQANPLKDWQVCRKCNDFGQKGNKHWESPEVKNCMTDEGYRKCLKACKKPNKMGRCVYNHDHRTNLDMKAAAQAAQPKVGTVPVK